MCIYICMHSRYARSRERPGMEERSLGHDGMGHLRGLLSSSGRFPSNGWTVYRSVGQEPTDMYGIYVYGICIYICKCTHIYIYETGSNKIDVDVHIYMYIYIVMYTCTFVCANVYIYVTPAHGPLECLRKLGAELRFCFSSLSSTFSYFF